MTHSEILKHKGVKSVRFHKNGAYTIYASDGTKHVAANPESLVDLLNGLEKEYKKFRKERRKKLQAIKGAFSGFAFALKYDDPNNKLNTKRLEIMILELRVTLNEFNKIIASSGQGYKELLGPDLINATYDYFSFVSAQGAKTDLDNCGIAESENAQENPACNCGLTKRTELLNAVKNAVSPLGNLIPNHISK